MLLLLLYIVIDAIVVVVVIIALLQHLIWFVNEFKPCVFFIKIGRKESHDSVPGFISCLIRRERAGVMRECS